MEEYPWGSDDTGYLPWIYEEVDDRGDELPEQFAGATELHIEAILELQPDLILAPWSGVTQEQYELLAEIAPTVAYPEQPWTIEWEQQIEIIGEAMGQPDEAQGLIDDKIGRASCREGVQKSWDDERDKREMKAKENSGRDFAEDVD